MSVNPDVLLAAAEDVKKLVAWLPGLIALGPELENIASIERAHLDAKYNLDKAVDEHAAVSANLVALKAEREQVIAAHAESMQAESARLDIRKAEVAEAMQAEQATLDALKAEVAEAQNLLQTIKIEMAAVRARLG